MAVPTMLAELDPTAGKQPLMDREDHLRGFLEGSGFAAGGIVVNGALTLATAVVFARWLRPEAFGAYSIALVTITLFGGLGALGMDTAVARFVAFYSGSGEREYIKPVLQFGLRWAVVGSVVLAVTVYLLLSFGSLLPEKLAPVRPLAAYVAITIPVFSVSLVLLQAVLHLGAIRPRMVIEKAALPLLRLVVPFLAVLFVGSRLAASAAGLLVASLLSGLLAAAVLTRIMVHLPRGASPKSEHVRAWSSCAVPLAFQSLQQFISNGLGIDILLVGILVSLSSSGIYAAAFRFSPLLTLVRVAMDYAFGPRVSRLFGQCDMRSIALLYKASSSIGLMFSLPFGIMFVLFSKPIMTTFFGISYASGASALAWLVCGCVADSSTGCNTTLLTMIGRPWLVLVNGLFGGIVTVVLCWTLIPHFGIAGAAFSVTASRVGVNTLATLELWLMQHLQPFSNQTWKLVVPAAVTALAGRVLHNVPIGNQTGVVYLGTMAAFLGAIYVFGLRLAGLSWSRSYQAVASNLVVR